MLLIEIYSSTGLSVNISFVMYRLPNFTYVMLQYAVLVLSCYSEILHLVCVTILVCYYSCRPFPEFFQTVNDNSRVKAMFVASLSLLLTFKQNASNVTY